MKKKFDVQIDISGLQHGLNKLRNEVADWADEAIKEMADTLLLLSQAEVPHDEGTLEKSGSVKKLKKGKYQVGYHTPYAAFQHEGGDEKRIITNYQKGRKKKFLENPLKENLPRWQKVFKKELAKNFK